MGATPMPTDPRPALPCNCRRCGRELIPGRGELYAVSVLAVADPYPPVFTEEDMTRAENPLKYAASEAYDFPPLPLIPQYRVIFRG
jgi:hypothetical protein